MNLYLNGPFPLISKSSFSMVMGFQFLTTLFFLVKNSQIAPKIFVWRQVHAKKGGKNNV